MNFFYDRFSDRNGLAQYSDYLNNESYLSDLRNSTADPLNYQLLEARKMLQSLSGEVVARQSAATKVICGTLEQGFSQMAVAIQNMNEDIREGFRQVNDGIDELHYMLDWKTDVIIEQQNITNVYLGQIAKLLEIPDSQKQRTYHVENGLKFLKIAIEEGPQSEYYQDANDEFLKAISIERKDHFSLYRLGFIRLHASSLLDVDLALNYFKDSAKYSKSAAFAQQL